jgi:hypothetical protein
MRHEAEPNISVAAEGDRRVASMAVGGEVEEIIFVTGSATEAPREGRGQVEGWTGGQSAGVRSSRNE